MYRLTDKPNVVIKTSGPSQVWEDAASNDWSDYLAWVDNGGVPDPYVPPAPPVPQTISDRQFFQQLAIMDIISKEEALAAVKTGNIPAVLLDFVDAIADPEARFGVNMLLSGATEFQRAHPLTEAIGAGQGMSSSDIDAFWRAASTI